MTVAKAILLFGLAALFEIGGAWLVWQNVREHRGWIWAGLGVIALGAYGFVATFQADPQFGRVLAAYGGVFVAGSLAWGMALDGFRPDRWDLIGAAVCLAGVGVIMYVPRGRESILVLDDARRALRAIFVSPARCAVQTEEDCVVAHLLVEPAATPVRQQHGRNGEQ